jgi:cytochrome c biogenesis protein CcdA
LNIDFIKLKITKMNDLSKLYKVLTLTLGAFMIFVYAGLGIVFLFFPDFFNTLKGATRIILGILLIMYAIFRVYRIIKKWRERDEEE